MIVWNILGYFGRNKQNSYAALKETQHHPNIGSSSRICWQVTMCARAKKTKIKAKENILLLYLYSLMTMDHLSCLSYGIYLNRNILLI